MNKRRVLLLLLNTQVQEVKMKLSFGTKAEWSYSGNIIFEIVLAVIARTCPHGYNGVHFEKKGAPGSNLCTLGVGCVVGNEKGILWATLFI